MESRFRAVRTVSHVMARKIAAAFTTDRMANYKTFNGCSLKNLFSFLSHLYSLARNSSRPHACRVAPPLKRFRMVW